MAFSFVKDLFSGCRSAVRMLLFKHIMTPDLSLSIVHGLRRLSRHDPCGALHAFEEALRACPASNTRDMYQICFYLGIALKRLGHSETAIKSWVACQRLRKRGHMRRLLMRVANEYGMEKQGESEIDDWKAFASIQMSRYMLSKHKRMFSTKAEQDMILDLIRDHWKSIVLSGALAGKNCSEKHSFFNRTRIVFPTVLIQQPTGTPVIPVNFHTHRRMKMTDKCYCGSGLPFSMCCGRTSGRDEIPSGIF
jgi:hypothetical protein